MAYGQCNQAPAHSPEVERALARAAGSWGGYQAWRGLDEDQRLNLVDCALKPANDLVDEYPIAL
jgi:hypothetical protein